MTENKKLPIIIAGVVLGLIILTAIFQNTPSGKLSEAMQAVPQNAGIIFETKDIGQFINELSENKTLLDAMANTEGLAETTNEIKYITQLLESNDDFRRFADGREFVISVHQSRKYQNSKLYISPIQEKNFKRFEETMRKLFPKASRETITYEDAQISRFSLSETPEYSFYFSFYNDFLLFGFSDVLIQKSIRALKTTASVSENPEFNKMHELTGKSMHRLFFNYQYLPETIFKYIAGNTQNVEFIKQFAGISGFEISITNNELLLDGYTLADAKDNYLGIFKAQAPGEHNLIKSLPYYTSSFILLNIGKGSEFKENYETFLAASNDLKNFRKNLNQWYRTQLGTEKLDFFECIGGELALISYARNARYDNRALIMIEINDRQKSIDFLKAYARQNKNEPNGFIAEGQNYIIFPFKADDFFATAFGSLFQNVNIETACLADDYFVFAESDSLMKEFLSDYGKVSDLTANEFLQSFNDESNIFIYGDVFKSNPLLTNYVSSQAHDNLLTDKDFWRKVQGPGIQFLADSDPVYTTFKLKLGGSNAANLLSEWECTLDSPPVTKPFVVKNHNTGDNEIVIQTQSNTVYLIDDDGAVLWKTIVDDRIISEVHQIDFYANNKLQLLFNTRNSLYLIDRNGNNVEDYPVEFKHKATNGISVFDYDNTRDYRIFFAAENKGVYALDKHGNALNGWVFGKTKGRVRQPVQYFRYESKDYICFFDDNKLYITNRRGEIRVKPAADFPVAPNTEIFFEEKTETSFPRFVLTNPTGSVYFVYLDGKVKRLKINEFSDKHFFMYADIAGDAYPEFIFADGKTLSAYGRDKEKLFSTETGHDITDRLYLYTFSKQNKQIGVINGLSDQVYLIKNDGTIESGFPIKGNTPFSIRVFGDNDYFSLIAGNSSVKLISYRFYQ